MKQQIVSFLLAAGLTISMLPATAFAADEPESTPETETASEASVREGLWITEVYPAAAKTTGEGTYEFIELTNTTKEPISFNEGYQLLYGSDTTSAAPVTVSALGEDGDVTIEAGETAVVWNRTDGSNLEQFKTEFYLPDSVTIYVTQDSSAWSDNSGYFALKTTGDSGETVCETSYKKGAEVKAGRSAKLGIPDFESQMLVVTPQAYPSPGDITSNQTGGISATPENKTPQGLYLTEVHANDKNRSADFGLDDKAGVSMEFIELTNTTDEPIDFYNSGYELWFLKSNDNAPMAATTYEHAKAFAKDGTSESEALEQAKQDVITIPAHGTAVFWIYCPSADVVDNFPATDDFRDTFDVEDDVPIYVLYKSGFGDENKGVALMKNEGDKKLMASWYYWDGTTDLDQVKSVELRISPEGSEMEIYRAKQTPTPGTLQSWDYQVTFNGNTDEATPEIFYSTDPFDEEELEVMDTGIDQGDYLRVPFNYKENGLPVTYIELIFRTDKMGNNWKSTTSTTFNSYKKWYAFVDSAYTADADWVEFYIKVHNLYRVTKTDIYKVDVHGDKDQTGIRVSLNSEDVADTAYSGTVQVSAKDFSGGTIESIEVDGVAQQNTTAAMERGAFFTFDYMDVSGYFKNALTTGGDTEETGTILSLFAACRTIPEEGSLAIAVPYQYFTYNQDGSATIDLTLRAGTWGSCWETFTEENNDDFTVSNLTLVLSDGTKIQPTSIVGTRANQAGTNTYGAGDSIKVGDSTGDTWNAYVTMTFNIPAENLTALGLAQTFALDTTGLSDGTHTITVTSTNGTKTADFQVDNSVPVEEEEAEPDYNLALTVDEDGTAQINQQDGADQVTVYRAETIDGITIQEGAGDSTANAVDVTDDDNETESTNGQYPYQILNIPVSGNEAYLKLALTAAADYDKDVQLYVLNNSENTWELLTVDRGADNQITAMVPAGMDYVSEGSVQVLVQARTTAYTPYTEEDRFNSKPGQTDEDWDGATATEDNLTDAPEGYDFAIAWFSDTQYYSEQYYDHYGDIVDWILKNRDDLGIEYVIHTGDIVDDQDEEFQWYNAKQQQIKLEEAQMPHGVLGGNHDVGHGSEIYDMYWKYFGAEYYEDMPWYGGSYKNNLGHYDIVEKDGQELLIIYISWDVHKEETDWINSVLAAHPNTKAIIATHGSIDADADESYTARYLQEHVCKNNPNVLAIVNGHYHGSSLNVVELTSDSGEKHLLYQICTDYQAGPEGGDGYLKMLYIDLSNNLVYINSYSPKSSTHNGEDDLNYYDTECLKFNDAMIEEDGHYTTFDSDPLVLPIDFGREDEKSLTVSDISVTGLSDSLDSAQLTGEGAELTLYGSGAAVGVFTDSEGNVVGATALAELPGVNPPSTGSGSTSHAVTVGNAANGKISVSPSRASSGQTVTVTVDPDEGYVLESLTVTDANGNTIQMTKVSDTRYTFVMPSGQVRVDAHFTQGEEDHVCPSEQFIDMDSNAWYHEGVDYVVSNGMMNGISATTFAPNSTTTRGMIVTILWRAAGMPAATESAGFRDVSSGEWYADAVAWASENGIVNGVGNGLFAPNAIITREQFASMMYRYAAHQGYDTSASADLSGYADEGQISSYAIQPMRWAVEAGLLQGVGGSRLSPESGATRAQAATIMMRFCERFAD